MTFTLCGTNQKVLLINTVFTTGRSVSHLEQPVRTSGDGPPLLGLQEAEVCLCRCLTERYEPT